MVANSYSCAPLRQGRPAGPPSSDGGDEERGGIIINIDVMMKGMVISYSTSWAAPLVYYSASVTAPGPYTTTITTCVARGRGASLCGTATHPFTPEFPLPVA